MPTLRSAFRGRPLYRDDLAMLEAALHSDLLRPHFSRRPPNQTPNAIVLALNAVKAALRSVITAPVNVLDENDGSFVTRILGVIGAFQAKPG